MTKPTRPKYTTADANQAAEHKKLKSWGHECIDVHDLPGNRLDAFVRKLPRGAWVQVEWKTKPPTTSMFTDNERTYFIELEIWNYVCHGYLEPLAQYRQHGQPVVVAWEAEQVRDVLIAMDVGGFRRSDDDRLKRLAVAGADAVNVKARMGT